MGGGGGGNDAEEPREARLSETNFTYLTVEDLEEATICVTHTPIQCHLWVLPSAGDAGHVR